MSHLCAGIGVGITRPLTCKKMGSIQDSLNERRRREGVLLRDAIGIPLSIHEDDGQCLDCGVAAAAAVVTSLLIPEIGCIAASSNCT